METIINQLEKWLQDLAQKLGHWLSIHFWPIVFILVCAWVARRFANRLIDQIIKRSVAHDPYPSKSDRDRRIKTLNTLMTAISRTAIYIVVAILLFGEISPVPVAALLTSAGLLGVAIGFGAQSLVKDVVSGIFIIIENQYRIGDIITVTNVTGTVEDITVRTTVLRDLDGNLHHVPNGSIVVTTNKTIGYSRINQDITVEPGTDIKQLEHAINHVGEQLAAKPEFKDVIIETPHFARIKGYSPNGMVIKVLGKTTAGAQWDVTGEFYKLLKEAFDHHEIKIAQNPLVLHKDDSDS